MRFLPTYYHGILDYLLGIILIASPWILGFYAGGAETIVPVIIGTSIILYSLFTDYEFGIARKIQMPIHLMLDVIGGVILTASPWLFNFNGIVVLPHLILGLLELGAGFMTQRVAPDCHTCKY